MSSLFLSYRRADNSGTVKHLHDRLKARLPQWKHFYDHEVLRPGEDLPDRLRQEITSAAVVLCVIGPRWVALLEERRQRAEIDHLLEEVRLALSSGPKVIPLLIENAAMPKEADLAAFPDLLPLCRLIGHAIRPDPDFDSDIERLAAFLDQVGPGVGAGSILGGKYKILREIGQGGMGVVYEAEQKQPRRIVAVKMILEGMHTKEVLARFDGEKEAVARMDHPNIARVIDSGSSPTGKPYFVMEMVRGEPITSYCDRKRLLPRDRLILLCQVSSAVQHAHQKGIIHRDIKPSNVLVEEVDGHPVPKVIDFGLAKALTGRLTDKTLISEVGKTAGTLIYASPEQAAGRQYDIDTRTDVYSLGALMYELLAGAPPFTEEMLKQVGDEAMRREIIETEPSKPSTNLSSSNALPTIAANRQLEPLKLTRQVRGELDWIVMRALEKEPKRRYETAGQLGEDIDRYLNDEPVKAGQPSQAYRLKKFIRRHRIPVIAGALIFAALVAGVLGTAWGLRVALKETEEKNVALEKRDHALSDLLEQERKTAAALASETEQRKQTAVALASETEQRKETANALALKTDQMLKLQVAIETLKIAMVSADANREEVKALENQVSEVNKLINEYKARENELNDNIQMLGRQLEVQERNNLELRKVVYSYSNILRRNGISTDPKAIAKREANDNLTGKVIEVDSAKGQVEISLGSDDGLEVGQELYVSRSKPNPESVGKISVISVEANQALGRVVGGTINARKINEGDIVSSTQIPKP